MRVFILLHLVLLEKIAFRFIRAAHFVLPDLRYYREFNIAYIFPLYIEEEPQLVFYDAKNQLIYDVNTPEQEQFLNEYLKEKGIDKEDKLSLSWYTRWGAKLLFLLLIGIPIAGMFCGKDDEIKEPKKL